MPPFHPYPIILFLAALFSLFRAPHADYAGLTLEYCRADADCLPPRRCLRFGASDPVACPPAPGARCICRPAAPPRCASAADCAPGEVCVALDGGAPLCGSCRVATERLPQWRHWGLSAVVPPGEVAAVTLGASTLWARTDLRLVPDPAPSPSPSPSRAGGGHDYDYDDGAGEEDYGYDDNDNADARSGGKEEEEEEEREKAVRTAARAAAAAAGAAARAKCRGVGVASDNCVVGADCAGARRCVDILVETANCTASSGACVCDGWFSTAPPCQECRHCPDGEACFAVTVNMCMSYARHAMDPVTPLEAVGGPCTPKALVAAHAGGQDGRVKEQAEPSAEKEEEGEEEAGAAGESDGGVGSGTATGTPVSAPQPQSPSTPVSVSPPPAVGDESDPAPSAELEPDGSVSSSSSSSDSGTATAASASGVCIGAQHLTSLLASELVFRSARRAAVLCDAHGSCATGGHVVTWGGRAMRMSRYCAARGVRCEVRHGAAVNSVRMRRGRRVASRTPGLEFTALAARYDSAAEELVLATLVSFAGM